jgi:hypothetical protein
VVHIGNDGLALSNKTRNNERGTCTNIGSTYWRTRQFHFTTHHCVMAIGANVGA